MDVVKESHPSYPSKTHSVSDRWKKGKIFYSHIEISGIICLRVDATAISFAIPTQKLKTNNQSSYLVINENWSCSSSYWRYCALLKLPINLKFMQECCNPSFEGDKNWVPSIKSVHKSADSQTGL
jgi:hypothetical protein